MSTARKENNDSYQNMLVAGKIKLPDNGNSNVDC